MKLIVAASGVEVLLCINPGIRFCIRRHVVLRHSGDSKTNWGESAKRKPGAVIQENEARSLFTH